MKKLLTASCILAASYSASAIEVDFDEKYVVGSFLSTTYDDFDSTIGFGVGIGAPIEDLELIDDSQLFVEVGYNILGEAEEDVFGGEVTLSASTLYALGKLQFEIQDQIVAYGKLGLNMISAEAEVDTGFGSASDDETEMKLLFGGGVGYQVNDEITVTGEYIKFASDVTSLTANLLYKF